MLSTFSSFLHFPILNSESTIIFIWKTRTSVYYHVRFLVGVAWRERIQKRRPGWCGTRQKQARERRKTDSCQETFYFMPLPGVFLVVTLFYIACMSFAAHTIEGRHRKKKFNLYLSFCAANLHIQLELKIVVCLKLSTVKWISSCLLFSVIVILAGFFVFVIRLRHWQIMQILLQSGEVPRIEMKRHDVTMSMQISSS